MTAHLRRHRQRKLRVNFRSTRMFELKLRPIPEFYSRQRWRRMFLLYQPRVCCCQRIRKLSPRRPYRPNEQPNPRTVSDLTLTLAGPVPSEHIFPVEHVQCDWEELEKCYDNISGNLLLPELIRVGRAEEMRWCESINVYGNVPSQVSITRGIKPNPCAMGRCQ